MSGTNKTERYMIIFNDVGLTVKGYYQEVITPIQRKKILDRLYSLIHRELFEGFPPLEAQETVTQPLPQAQTTSPQPIEPRPKRQYKKKRKYARKDKPLSEAPPSENFNNQEPLLSTQIQQPGPKDPVYDNENDNQYNEFKKKGLI